MKKNNHEFEVVEGLLVPFKVTKRMKWMTQEGECSFKGKDCVLSDVACSMCMFNSEFKEVRKKYFESLYPDTVAKVKTKKEKKETSKTDTRKSILDDVKRSVFKGLDKNTIMEGLFTEHKDGCSCGCNEDSIWESRNNKKVNSTSGILDELDKSGHISKLAETAASMGNDTSKTIDYVTETIIDGLRFASICGAHSPESSKSFNLVEKDILEHITQGLVAVSAGFHNLNIAGSSDKVKDEIKKYIVNTINEYFS